MKFAYADPPYFGLGGYYAKHHPRAHDWNKLETHKDLIDRLVREYPEGWALSLHAPSLKDILPLCPREARVCAWVKPFASFKPGVSLAYTWEPVILYRGRLGTRKERTRRDHLSCNITLKKGLVGAKPEKFCEWVLALLNAKPGDTVDDIFPGTGVMTTTVRETLTDLFGDLS